MKSTSTMIKLIEAIVANDAATADKLIKDELRQRITGRISDIREDVEDELSEIDGEDEDVPLIPILDDETESTETTAQNAPEIGDNVTISSSGDGEIHLHLDLDSEDLLSAITVDKNLVDKLVDVATGNGQGGADAPVAPSTPTDLTGDEFDVDIDAQLRDAAEKTQEIETIEDDLASTAGDDVAQQQDDLADVKADIDTATSELESDDNGELASEDDFETNEEPTAEAGGVIDWFDGEDADAEDKKKKEEKEAEEASDADFN